MFTWMWTRKFTQMANRVQELEVTREENLFSSNLSVRTLETAPDFWNRQHQAFSYLDRQLHRMNRRTRTWGAMALLAILADAAIVVGALTAFTSFQHYQAANQVQQLAQDTTQIDDLMTRLGAIAADPNQPLSDRVQASRILTYQLEQGAQWGQGTLQRRPPQTQLPSSALTSQGSRISALQDQLQAIQHLSAQGNLQAIKPLTTLLNHDETLIRAAAAQALGQLPAPQAMEAMHKRLLIEENDGVRQALIGSLANLAQRG